MKKKILWILGATLLILACQFPFINTPTPEPPATLTAPAPATVTPTAPSPDDLSIFSAGLIASQQHYLNELKDASFYSIDYVIDDNMTDISGKEKVKYTNREDIALDEIQFRLLPNVLSGSMKVTSVRVDGQPFEPTYELENSLMRVPIYARLEPGQSTEIEVEFSVSVPTELESNYGILAYYDGVLTLAHSYPMIAVYDDEGWNAEIPPDQGDPTYADASFFLVNVDAPKQLVLVGSGREIERQDNGNRQIVTFAAGPARDFYVAASADYKVQSETVGEVTFNSYAPKGLQAGAKQAIDDAVAAFKVFDKRYSPYPYTEFDIVTTPTYALGIEYPGVVAITNNIYDMGSSSYGTTNRAMMESVVVHEGAHQWFYNMIGNDQLDEPWLDESLAQFVTWRYYIDRYGEANANGFKQSLESRWARVENENIPIGMPVAKYDGAAYSAIIYGRGAFFFDALRKQIGDTTFDTFMLDYAETNTWGIATGESLKKLAEKDCGCDLTPLYEEWVYP